LARVAKDRKTGRAEIVDLTTDALITFLTDHGNFRVMISDKTSREVACPQQIAVQMIHEWEKTRYPALEGIIPAPQFAEDGTLIVTPGYHPGSGLYYAPPVGFEIEPVPDVPTRKDVANAVDLWRDLFADFPFLDMGEVAGWGGIGGLCAPDGIGACNACPRPDGTDGGRPRISGVKAQPRYRRDADIEGAATDLVWKHRHQSPIE
jgi:hypothetical protein